MSEQTLGASRLRVRQGSVGNNNGEKRYEKTIKHITYSCDAALRRAYAGDGGGGYHYTNSNGADDYITEND